MRGSTRSRDHQGSGTGRDAWILRTDVDGMLQFDAGNGSDAHAAATTLAPAAAAVALTTGVPPLTMSAATAQVTVRTDG